MKIKGINFEAEWTKDCGSKENFDFSVIRVDTRYWGDYTAKPSIYLGDKVLYELPKEQYIEGDSEIECKYKTEQWIKEKLEKLIDIIFEKVKEVE
ncbi:MAG: hypothetical protein H0Z24_05805 [Thermosipho sp. (in: Bacteria)]|nr:hypothetical protein [Thermosipho sp. (in: thermotogales)]